MRLFLEYHEKTYTPIHCFGTVENGMVKAYIIDCTAELLKALFSDKPQKSSDSVPAMIVKYRPNDTKIALLKSTAFASIDLMTVESLEKSRRLILRKSGKSTLETRGECFEWLIANALNGRQNPVQNCPHTDGADIYDTIYGDLQVKYIGATIRLGRWKE